MLTEESTRSSCYAGLVANDFPRWIDRSATRNLREVGRNLYVGAEGSPAVRVGNRDWSLVVDLYGVPLESGRLDRYTGSVRTVTWPFLDGDHFPPGLLGLLSSLVPICRKRGPTLVHCQAGLSRSASAAYAMLRLQDRLSHDEALRRVTLEPGFPRTTTIASARSFVQRQ